MKRLFIAILFVFPIILSAQDSGIYFNVSAPQYIPSGKAFDIFCIVKFPDIKFDEVYFYILPGERIPIQEISAYNSNSTHKLKFEETEFGNYKNAYLVHLNRSDTLYDFNSVFRFKLSIAQSYEQRVSVNYALAIFKDGNTVQAYSSLIKNSPINESEINFYKPQSVAGKCLLLEDEARYSLSIDPLGNETGLLAEFWLKQNNANSDFLQIINTDTKQNYFTIGLNSNGFVYLTDFSRTFYSGLSLSKNSWYHFVIFYSGEKVRVFCNKDLIYENALYKSIKDDFLRLTLVNNDNNSPVYFDQLRVWNYRDNVEQCFSNAQYVYAGLEKSELLYQDNLNDDFTSSGASSVKQYETRKLRYVQSDAPIISKAPELNVAVSSGYCTLEWSNNDIQKPKNYIVEKSLDGIIFTEIFKTVADEDQDKTYYYSDTHSENGNITYYRVKQINYNGSEVYSSSIKVGLSAKKEKVIVGQNYPNPFNPTTTFTVEMLETADAKIIIYNLVGKTIAVLYDGTLSAGVHNFYFDGTNLPSGLYLYAITTPSGSIVKKMILTK